MVDSLSLPEINLLASDGGYTGLAALSNFSAAMLLSACTWLHSFDNWTGADGDDLTDAEKDEIFHKVSTAEHELMIASLGLIIPHARQDVPGWMLICDGTIYNEADYPELYSVLDPVFIISPTQFQVPDLRDRFIGVEGTLNIGDTGGAINHTITVAQMPSHSHTTIPHAHTYFTPSVAPLPIGGGVPAPAVVPTPFPRLTGSNGVTVNNTGNGEPINHLPPYYVLRFAIIAGS